MRLGPLNLAPKVASTLLGSWVSTLILYVLHRYVDADLPVEVGAAIVSLVGFVCGWAAPPQTRPASANEPEPPAGMSTARLAFTQSLPVTYSELATPAKPPETPHRQTTTMSAKRPARKRTSGK